MMNYREYIKNIENELRNISSNVKYKNRIIKAKKENTGKMLKIYLMEVFLDILQAQVNFIKKNINNKSFFKTDNPQKCYNFMLSRGDKLYKIYKKKRDVYHNLMKKDAAEHIKGEF